jgi:hypothetical protein
MLGFSMIALSFLIAGIFFTLFVIAAAAAIRYENAKRDEHHAAKPKRDSREPLIRQYRRRDAQTFRVGRS